MRRKREADAPPYVHQIGVTQDPFGFLLRSWLAVGAFVEAWAPPGYTSVHIRVNPSVNMASAPLERY